MRRRSKEQWGAIKRSKFLDGVDTVATGPAFIFVFFIYATIVHAFLFRRHEVDFSVVGPVFILLNVIIIARWFWEGRLQKECRETSRRKHFEMVKRADSNAILRERLTKEDKHWHYDHDGNLVYR